MLQVLGCPRSASRAAIRAAYLERMKLLHPDMNLDEDTTVQAVAINAAYLTLTEARQFPLAISCTVLMPFLTMMLLTLRCVFCPHARGELQPDIYIASVILVLTCTLT